MSPDFEAYHLHNVCKNVHTFTVITRIWSLAIFHTFSVSTCQSQDFSRSMVDNYAVLHSQSVISITRNQLIILIIDMQWITKKCCYCHCSSLYTEDTIICIIKAVWHSCDETKFVQQKTGLRQSMLCISCHHTEKSMGSGQFSG